jgi:hypothetical protein
MGWLYAASPEGATHKKRARGDGRDIEWSSSTEELGVRWARLRYLPTGGEGFAGENNSSRYVGLVGALLPGNHDHTAVVGMIARLPMLLACAVAARTVLFWLAPHLRPCDSGFAVAVVSRGGRPRAECPWRPCSSREPVRLPVLIQVSQSSTSPVERQPQGAFGSRPGASPPDSSWMSRMHCACSLTTVCQCGLQWAPLPREHEVWPAACSWRVREMALARTPGSRSCPSDSDRTVHCGRP